VLAAEVDTNSLAPPADKQIDFVRDIKPILEANCMKCHGTERPKNGFSLTTRASALKGGEQGIDIIPGESARSPLIHYVSGLVEDMVMPPERTGLSLSAEQVGLLRAWIDQGLVWEKTEEPPVVEGTATPALGYTWVSGDEHKFRELYWYRDGWNGGLESFESHGPAGSWNQGDHLGSHLQRGREGRSRRGKERAWLHPAGMAPISEVRRRQWRDIIQPFFPSIYTLDRDLHTDVGRAWADFGLNTPALASNCPRL
jgi:hypothetical protein